jgi:DNA polymerase III alpha subunit
MKTTKFGEIVLNENDLCDLVMKGTDVSKINHVIIDPDFDLEKAMSHIEDPSALLTWTFPEAADISVPEFDLKNQQCWYMPKEYRELDIAEHVLSLCSDQAQLQRVGHELLLYQERDMFDLLRYLKYLVDVMKANNVIWGVGRGSSVASYVLYLLGVHRIDSMYYDLDPGEFLR